VIKIEDTRKKEGVRRNAQLALEGILLIITACFPGSWISQYLTLLTAKKTPSIALSGCCGGFTNVLVAGYVLAHEFNAKAPSADGSSHRGQQHSYDDLSLRSPSDTQSVIDLTD
jgi:hypothetical protein